MLYKTTSFLYVFLKILREQKKSFFYPGIINKLKRDMGVRKIAG